MRLGPDPLGIAATLGVDPAAFWRAAGAQVTASGPKLGARARIRSDGSAVLSFTPPEPGGVVVRMYVSGHAIQAALGLCSAPVSGVGAALVRPGGTPGSPVLRVEDVARSRPPTPVVSPRPGRSPSRRPGRSRFRSAL